MDIMEWKKRIAEARKSLPNPDWSPQDRLLSLVSQIADIANKIQFQQGTRTIDKRPKQSIQTLIIGTLEETLLLCDMFNVDINTELEKAIKWCLYLR